MKQRHVEKEEYISRLARDKEEMKVGHTHCILLNLCLYMNDVAMS